MDVFWLLFEVLMNVYQLGICVYMLSKLFPPKDNLMYPGLALWGCVLLGTVGLTVLNSIGVRGNYDFVPGVLAFFAYVFLFRKGHWLFKVMWVCICWVIMSGVSALMIALFLSLPNVDLNAIYNNTSIRFTIVICVDILLIPFAMLLPKLQKEQRNEAFRDAPTLVLLLSVPVASAGFVILIQRCYSLVSEDHLQPTAMFLAACTALFMSVSVLWLFDHMVHQAKKLAQLEVDARQITLEKRHQKELIEIYDQMRIWRHDFRNHLAVIQGLAEQHRDSNLEKYVTEFTKEFTSIDSFFNTGNVAIDTLLNAKRDVALKHKIAFSSDVHLPDPLPLSGTDFCGLVGNLLDNAYEACSRIEDESGKYIELQCDKLQDYLRIIVCNPTTGNVQQVGDRYVTEKEDKAQHGFGLRSVERIVKSCGGYTRVDHTGNVFRVTILIPCRG